MRRRRSITLETEKIVIRGDLRDVNWCHKCAASTLMLPAERAGMLLGEHIESLVREAEQGKVHSMRTSNGILMVCLKSLPEAHGIGWQPIKKEEGEDK